MKNFLKNVLPLPAKRSVAYHNEIVSRLDLLGQQYSEIESNLGQRYNEIESSLGQRYNEVMSRLDLLSQQYREMMLRLALTRAPGRGPITPDAGDGWDEYYDNAEGAETLQVEHYIIPLLSKHTIPFNRVLDFPSGRGRIAEAFYKVYAENIEYFVCCDANSNAIDNCRERFAGNDVFDYMVNKTHEYQCIPFEFSNESFTFVYSFDSMVHFSYKWIDFYMSEFYRILDNGGYLFIHHSNLGSPDVVTDNRKSEIYYENPGGRSPNSAEDIRFISEKHGFSVVEQNIFDWAVPNSDCVTLLKK
ncbi:MAG: class I SAM-dependent methyltransferase [Oscillospiraceae bacterium]|nr:class I SAM-dependent methyltransferase [Oscillospiraceae bacterium]